MLQAFTSVLLTFITHKFPNSVTPHPEGIGECAALQELIVPSHLEGGNFPHALRLKLEAQGCEII